MTRSVVLPRGEVQFRYSRSSGPGGQHAQKSETRVEAVFDVEAVPDVLLAPRLLERLVEQLRQALRVERRRLPTKPTEASRRRRLDEKRRRSQTKRLRRELDD